MTVKSDGQIRGSKNKTIQLFFRTHENAKNGLHKKMILRLSKCKKVLLMNNNNTKEKKFTTITAGIACFININTVVTPVSFESLW